MWQFWDESDASRHLRQRNRSSSAPGHGYGRRYAHGVHTGQTLIFDADDTLWANNVHFERVITDYLGWLAHPTLEPAEIRGILDDIERANTVTHGYGSQAFLANLAECFDTLNGRPVTDAEQLEISRLATALLEHRIELFPGVADTLVELGSRHDLKLMTKGHQQEQQRKVDASGLAGLFSSIHIVPEKNPDAYREVLASQSLSPESTWMIGNSPASDILPARAVGLRTVFIPAAETWVLEQASLDAADDGVLTLGYFRDLIAHF